MTILGAVRVERAYYHCSHCHAGHCPRDAALGLTKVDLSRGATQVRYVCGLTGGLKALGEPLRNQAAQVGMDGAERWVAISDGGAGIEDWLRDNFPRVEAVVLDFYHVAEYLSEWAK